MAVFLLISLSCFAANVHTGAAMPAASYTYGLQQNATHPVQMLNGQPPVGYAGATGTYIPVQATAGLELPVRFMTPPSIALVSSGSIEIEPNSTTMGSGTAGAVPTTPLGILLHLSDGTNIQQWLTAVILGDGINGNNTGAVTPWMYNGTTWDRVRGNASDGLLVRSTDAEAAIATAITDINILNASLTQSLTQIENAASATTAKIDSESIKMLTTIATMSSNFSASATANPTSAWATMLGLSDNSAIQRWFTALVIGDGVNGNNTAAIAPWVFNGSTFDRMRGNASDGIFVSEVLCVNISTATLTITSTSQDVSALTDRKWISFQNQGTQTVCIHPNGTPAVYGSGRLLYPQGSITYNNIDDSVKFSLVCDTALSSSVFVEQGVK